MAEFITRVNYGMVLGNFEMDYDDGEIRFKTSIDLEGAMLTDDLVKPLVYANCLMMDKYLPGIMQVISGLPADVAVIGIENPVSTEGGVPEA